MSVALVIDLQAQESLVLHGEGILRDISPDWVDRPLVLAVLYTEMSLVVNRVLQVVIEGNHD